MFKECGSGLYYYDMESTDLKEIAKINVTINPYYLLSNLINYMHALILKGS